MYTKEAGGIIGKRASPGAGQGCHVALQVGKAIQTENTVGLSPIFTLTVVMKGDMTCSTC